MVQSMKGLQLFISDLRSAKVQEDEEKRINAELFNIQKQFLQPNISGYQRKKYVYKLIYIYILGHKLTFGYMEAIQLLSSKVYSEKEVGYLAVSLFLNESHEMLTLVINTLKLDLESDISEFVALALNCIATIANEEISSILCENVFLLLRSPTSLIFIKKKAALALLRLIRVNPSILEKYRTYWVPRILALLDDFAEDFGLALSVTSLMGYIAKQSQDTGKIYLPILIDRLYSIIIGQKYPIQYIYNKVPAPWLTVQLLNLVEDLILCSKSYSSLAVTNIDKAHLGKLRSVVAKCIENGRLPAVSGSQFNAQNAILFSAVSLATRLDPSLDAIAGAIDALCKLLTSKESNIRYLTLDTLIKIMDASADRYYQAVVSNSNKLDDLFIHDSVKKHTASIISLLNDVETSVRQKAFDTLCLIADFQCIETLSKELLKYLEDADYIYKSTISQKLYSIVEKFAKDFSWYVTVTLKIVSTAKNYLNSEVWKKFMLIVTNSSNNNFKIFACKSAIKHLKYDPIRSPTMIKICAFLLGEYCHLLVSENEELDSPFSMDNQYNLLYDNYYATSLRTRFIILSAFLKFYKKDASLRQTISKFFRTELNSVNTEIQQRSIEYIKLISRNDGLLDIVVGELPIMDISRFKSQKLVLSRLEKKGFVADKNLLEFDEKETQNDDLDNNRLLSPLNAASENPFDDSASSSSTENDEEAKDIVLTSNWEIGYYKLMRTNKNVLFENSIVKITAIFTFLDLKTEKKIGLKLEILNKSPADITSLITNTKFMQTKNPLLLVKTLFLPDNKVSKNNSTSWNLEVVPRMPFRDEDAPVLEFNIFSGSFTSLKLKLPMTLMKCITATSLSQKHFDSRWAQLVAADNPTLSNSACIPVQKCIPLFRDLINIRKFLTIVHWGECTEEKNSLKLSVLKFAGIIHTSTKGNFGTLLVFALTASNQYEITIRSTGENIASTLISSLKNTLIQG